MSQTADNRTRWLALWLVVQCIVCLHNGSRAVSTNSSAVHKRLRSPTRCPRGTIAPANTYRTLKVRSVLECLALCRPDDKCLSIVFDADNRQCYHSNNVSRLDCSNMALKLPGVKYYETEVVCDNEYEELGPDGVCVCVDGYRGKPCAPYIADCQEGYDRGNFSGNGVHYIHPRLSPHPFLVNCKNQTNNARTYILDRRNNNLNFNTSYADYRAGFGDTGKDHWLGLDKVYQLTNSKTYELRVSVKLKNGTSFFMQYQEFSITDKADGYRLLFNRSVQVYRLSDCFSPLYGAQFSAQDHDRDEDSTVNCARRHGGGWWFRGSNCSLCNPTGPLVKSSDGLRTGVDAEAFWTQDVEDYALYRVTMFLVVLGG